MITIYWGPVKSGKSLNLLRQLKLLSTVHSFKCLLVGYNISDSNNEISSRFYNITESCIRVTNLYELGDPLDMVDIYDYIFIDELQFFDDCYDFIIKTINNGINIYASCLNGDYKQDIFGNIVNLLPYANIIMCKSVCSKCGKDACFSIRIKKDGSNYDRDKYIPVCNKHI